jgi:hypothetical protein
VGDDGDALPGEVADEMVQGKGRNGAMKFVKVTKFGQCVLCGEDVPQRDMSSEAAVIPVGEHHYVFAHMKCWRAASPDRPWEGLTFEQKVAVGNAVLQAQ